MAYGNKLNTTCKHVISYFRNFCHTVSKVPMPEISSNKSI